ncbi:MAG: alginate export family protein [Candidatus Azobacteroides sp.]|nr:alginate export family protein [Candidatus Azobacteroides sp.]
MRKNVFLSVVAFLLIVVQLYGQTVKVDAEIRSRGELRDGFREPLADTLNAAYVNNLRTKLNFLYENRDIRAKLSLLDTRTYGGTDVGKTGNGVGVLEAWGEYYFTPELSFVLGRQGVEYDDKRLFSYNNWSNTPGAHDLLRLKYESPDITIHVGSAYNNAGDSTQFFSPYTQTYKTLNYIWLSRSFGKISASALWVNDSFEHGTTGDISTTYRNTVGGNIWLTNKKAPFTFHASGYYQFGRDKKDRSLSAYLLSLNAKQLLNERIAVHIGGDVFSGSGYDIASDKSNTFNKLYGTNHAFNGSIEYWSTLPTQGLIDIFAGLTGKFSSKFDINITYHHFSTSRDIDESGKTNLGSEIDITANYYVNKEFTLQGGWSSYFTTKGSDILKNKINVDTHFPQWAYIQVTFTPVFFSHKN